MVPGGPLVQEPLAEGVSRLAEDDVEGGLVEVSEVGSEAFGGAEGAADLFDGGAVAGLRLDAGADGDSDDAADEGREGEDGVLDVYGVLLTVGPGGEVVGGVGFGEGLGDGGGEEVVPGGVFFGEPAGGGMHDDLLFGVGFGAPGVELPGGAEAGREDDGPEGVADRVDDGGGGGVDVDVAVPVAEDVCGLVEALGFGG